ncbi:sensor histidine kinase [Hyalangium minutum]|uniref:histidine kinase n=1 Tax=Hyalangium minutum TaxID=394096 RepID=A0A085W781_9BACT|nr:sensor histidine kinase [Hyalangium minutum]KFE63544.1 Sensory box histidine kinase [Hyalangium minutum]
MVLITGALLPVVAFSGLMVLRLTRQMQEGVERRLQNSAHEITWAFDREVSATIRTLQALAQSGHLDEGDVEGFRTEALRVQRSQPSWLTVILLTTEGQQLMNLRRPSGAPLPRATEPESLRRTVEDRQAVVGGLVMGNSGQYWGFPIRVPVIRDDQVLYVLSAIITPEALVDVVGRQSPAEGELEFTRVVVDREGLVAYRTRNPERFIGQPATGNFIQNTREGIEGVFRSVTLEGEHSYVAFSRSGLSGWLSAVVVPDEIIDEPFRRSVRVIAASGLLVLLISLTSAIVFARRFAGGLRSMAGAAEALASGEQPRVERSSIEEMERLGLSLTNSAERLRQHQEEERRSREGLEAAVRSRDEFLSLASHELKTPLTSLMLQTQLLQRRMERGEALPPERVGRLLEQTSRQAQRLARLVDDMLDISRLAAGKLSLEPDTFDLVELAAEVAAKLGPQMTEARCEVSVRVTEPVVGAWDRYRLEQVLTNFLTNAARYSAGKPVEVTVQKLEAHVELRVRDQGRGIAPEDHARIFQKFERAVHSHEVSGLGLGLFIVREIVEMHQGTVRVESALGQGATFIVTLPLRSS